MERTTRMQQHLSLIRRSLGWSTEKLGDEIGVTRQTIFNIENARTNLSKTQYLAIKSVINDYISANPEETQMTVDLFQILVENPNEYTESQRDEIIRKAELLSPSMASDKIEKTEVSKEWKLLTAGIIAAAATAAIAGTVAILKNKK